MRGQLHF